MADLASLISVASGPLKRAGLGSLISRVLGTLISLVLGPLISLVLGIPKKWRITAAKTSTYKPSP